MISSGMVEHIVWHSTRAGLPDSGLTVLVSISGDSEPVWLGWLEDGQWHDASTGDHIGGTVVAWADVPEGFFPRLDDATPGAPA